jgi:hypothetical protein
MYGEEDEMEYEQPDREFEDANAMDYMAEEDGGEITSELWQVDLL